ncbi:MAG TPA: metal ABC transporter substrate-binding protein [Acidimicrobiia bacterium]|nr:metal ABC transporter substrate-binding protein [Acidimicrobiia bacterium]
MRSIARIAVSLALIASACGGSPATTTDAPAGRVSVVATTTIAADLARMVVGDAGDVVSIMPSGADPHDFSPSARQLEILQEADLVMAFGLGLEEGLEAALESVEDQGVPIVWLAPALGPLPFEPGDEVEGHEPQDEDEEDGHDHDDHDELDPHVWMDPVRVADALRIIALRLEGLVPSGGWETRASDAAAEFLTLDQEIRDIVAAVPGDRRLLVTNHHSLGYFADRYGFLVLGTVIPGGGTHGAPSSADIAGLVALITSTGVPAIFTEDGDTTDLAEAIAAEVPHEVRVISLTTDSLGEPGSETGTLLGLLRFAATTIVEALS